MKKRNPLAVFFLSIITFGIYDIYWLVQTKKVLNKKTRHHTPTIWLLVAPVPIIIIGYILLFTAGNITTTSYSNGYTTYNSATTNHVAHPANLILAFIMIFVGITASFIISIIWFFKFSKAINEYTQGKMSTATSFLILWLIHLIGVALIQDAFNDMGESAPANNQPLPANS